MPAYINVYEKRSSGLNHFFSHDLLTGRRIFYPFGLIKKSTSYCRDETDLITHTGGPDFAGDFYICLMNGPHELGGRAVL